MSTYLRERYGKYALPDGLFDITGPVSRQLYAGMPRAIKCPKHREGIGFRGKDVIRYSVTTQWAMNTEQALMNVLEQLEGNYEAAALLWERYKTRLVDFRSAVKNDVASLDAAAKRSTDATNKMVSAYGHVIEILNSTEMEKAVQNAERLAAAMQALANLQSHKLVLSVVDQSKDADM